MDPGYDHIGVSATTKDKVLFEGIYELSSDVVKNISSGRSGRTRELRYREPGFNNRKRESGWLPPSDKSGPDCHINIIEKLRIFLPVGKVNVEIAKFDIQKIKNPDIKGAEYQQGEQLNFWNVREYVSARDGHVCRCCKGKSKDRILNVHHLESRKTGSDSPGNLITLYETCHKEYHKGLISLDGVEKGNACKAETFMGLVRNYLFIRLQEDFDKVGYTYGYITKCTRAEKHLDKGHNTDARCISGNPVAKPTDVYLLKKVGCHNRQLHKCTTLKGGVRKLNNSP